MKLLNRKKKMDPYICTVCEQAFPSEYTMRIHKEKEALQVRERAARMKYYKDPVSGKIYNDPKFTKERKSMYPATELQKERIKELKERPEFAGKHLDWLIECITKNRMLETRGAAGKLIAAMKQIIRDEGGIVE